MSIARVTEIKSSSTKSFEDAVQVGITRATKTLKNVKSAWIQDQEVLVDEKGKISEYRVDMKVTFILEE
jgi:dodecin